MTVMLPPGHERINGVRYAWNYGTRRCDVCAQSFEGRCWDVLDLWGARALACSHACVRILGEADGSGFEAPPWPVAAEGIVQPPPGRGLK